MAWLKEKSPFIIVSFVLGLLMVLFLIVPILGSLANAFPGLSTALTDEGTLNAIWTSFYCAFIATVFVLVLGVPFAYLFVRNEFHGKKILGFSLLFFHLFLQVLLHFARRIDLTTLQA